MFGLGHARVWTLLDVFLSLFLQIKADFRLDLDQKGGRKQSSLNPVNAVETPPKKKLLHIFPSTIDLRSFTKPNQGWRIICNLFIQIRD